ncbi:MAG TPA: hypothetical protein VFW87_09100 [Pirellulales bacterium]|nr:hypothetical protein [Pirellulales bacterium]
MHHHAIVSCKEYVAGWFDSSIHDFLSDLPPQAAGTRYALITCLDSNRAPASLRANSPELQPLKDQTREFGSGLLVPTELLLEANSTQQIFFGFDELWLFPSEPSESKPDSAWLVGPARIGQSTLDQLSVWMSKNGCSLGLGDGEGLNTIVKARGLPRYLIGHSLEQPQSTLSVAASRAT